MMLRVGLGSGLWDRPMGETLTAGDYVIREHAHKGWPILFEFFSDSHRFPGTFIGYLQCLYPQAEVVLYSCYHDCAFRKPSSGFLP